MRKGRASKQKQSAEPSTESADSSNSGTSKKPRVSSKTVASKKKASTKKQAESAATTNDNSGNEVTHQAPASRPTIEAPSGKVRQVPIVALGASAGGLEPIEQFFDAAEPDSGIAFVIIQHLSPDFDSMMEELLSRHSKMPIFQATDGLKIVSNTIYLNPPRTDMRVEKGCLRLTDAPPGNQLNLPINAFFESLAIEYKSRAIGIILSGTGTDGTLGARSIKQAGGRILAQAPDSTKFPGMPASVINNGLADAFGSPGELFGLVRQIRSGVPLILGDQKSTDFGNPIVSIFAILRQRFGTEFGYYKEATILRRLDRRIRRRNISIDDYAALLQVDKVETAALYSDLLVEVTEFFRDAQAFEVIKLQVVPQLVANMTGSNPIRIWVPGCASGEEAYTLAVLIAERALEDGKPLNLKIFATDIHSRSLNAASKGIYEAEDLTGLTEQQRDRYFTYDGHNYQVNQALRSTVVFSAHNVLKDPPFTRMHLISCRNVLIYFNDIAQHKALALFHGALPKDGYLFLGPSESTNKISNEFSIINQKWRVFRKKNDSRLPEASTLLPSNLNMEGFPQVGSSPSPPSTRPSQPRRENIGGVYHSALERVVREYAPPGFLLTVDGEILHVFGDAAANLNMAAGQFSSSILALIDKRLVDVVGTGLKRLKVSGDLPFQRRVNIDDQTIVVGMRAVAPQAGADTESDTPIFLTFDTEQQGSGAKTTTTPINSDGSDENLPHLLSQIRHLEGDLASTENSLKATVESFETSNEELQASNEELMASNEELQSTNEELHSVNEELFTVSAEHQRKIDELTELTDDMNHLFDATDIGVIFLDQDFCVRRFTPSAQLTFNLLPHDLGRPIGHITYKFEGLDLHEIVREVRSDGQQRQHEIEVDGKGFVLRVLPYVGSVEGTIGEVITTVDISEVKEEQSQRLQIARQYEEIVSDITERIVRWRPADNAITYCNQLFSDRIGIPIADLIGRNILEVSTFVPQLKLTDRLKTLQPGGSIVEIVSSKIAGQRDEFVSIHARTIFDTNGNVVAYQAVGRDVTEEQCYLQALEALAELGEEAGDDDNAFLDGLLRVGSEYFDLPLAVFSRINGDELTVHSVTKWSPARTPGDTASLENTIGSLQPKYDKTLAIDHFSKSEFASHKSYELSGIETYIGTRVVTLKGTSGGIIAFASLEPRQSKFSWREIAFAQLLARTAGTVVDRLQEIDRLASSRTFYQETYIQTPAMMCTLDTQGVIIEVTDEWLSVLAQSRQGVIGKKLQSFLTEESRVAVADVLGNGLFCNTYRKSAAEFRTGSGTTLQTEVSSITRNSLETGEKQFLLLIEDVTERVEALSEVERQKSVLEQSNESLTQFAYIASHDFQEPLRKIRQFADLLAQDYGDQFDDDGKYYLDVMTGSATRISGLVTDLLSYSRAANQPINQVPINLNALLADLRTEFSAQIVSTNAKLSVADLPTVVGDKAAAHQLFHNLISNALKYHRPDESPELLIASSQRGNQTLLHFSDKGIGIDDGAGKSIFEPFVRLQHRTDYEGTGIGLAICKAVCDRLGWTLSYTSKADEGTIFTVSLPTTRIDPARDVRDQSQVKSVAERAN